MADEKPNSFFFIVTAMTIVAISDGRLSQQEKEVLIQLVSVYKRGLSSPTEVLSTVDQTVSSLHDLGRSGWKSILESGKEMPRESKRQVLDSATKMAFVNGKPNRSMMGLLGRIAFWVGVSEKDLVEWRREVRELMKLPSIRSGLGP